MGCSNAGRVPKKARTATNLDIKFFDEQEEMKVEEEEGEEVEEEEKGEEICNVFTVEMDNLECDICFQPFESQVYTCKNGHVVCANCCITMKRTCPSCNEPIGDSRCRATEKILAGMTRPCRYKKHGCLQTVRYTEARRHGEEVCRYAPYSCPFDGCAYRGRLHLYGHILNAHDPGVTYGIEPLRQITVTLKKCEPFRALLHVDVDRVFLLLNGGDVLKGRSLSLVSICPYPDEEDEWVEALYTMAVKGVDEPGSLSLTASGTPQFVRRLQGHKAKWFLFVPDAFWGSSGTITVTVYL